MIYIYTVQKVALLLGKSDKTIYRYINKLPNDILSDILIMRVGENGKETKHFTEKGFKTFCEYFNFSIPNVHQNNNIADNDIIALLTEQLKIKDEQIALLIEQNRNFQVLLKAEQDKQLPPPKIPLIKRLFGKSGT